MKTNLFKNALIIASGAAILASCGSTPSKGSVNQPEVVEKVKKEPRQITVQNTSTQKEKDFKALLKDIELKLTSSPNPKKTVFSGAAFTSPYVVSVTDSNGPVVDFEVSITWPVTRNNDTISYNTVTLKTDEEGKISFLPPVSNIAVKDKITFYPTPVSSSSAIIQEAYKAGVEAPFNVKSKYTQWPGGIIFVYDYNEKGNPTTNNFAILQNLRNAGINAGNAPLSDAKYLDKPVSEVYKTCHDIVGNAAQFLVLGTVKYAEPSVTTEEGATVKMVCHIYCINMKDGSILYETSLEDTVTDKNTWAAEQKCKTQLGEKAADLIIYGM